jgi:predicted hotdog family 3-hydroxylacyl-ACP dehydratase
VSAPRAPDETGAPDGTGAPAPPGPGALLPHGPPARWIDEVLARGEGELVCRGRIPAASPFARGGTAPALAGLELAAQAAAVLEALDRAGAGGAAEPRRGYLVRVREAALAAAGIPAGAPLVVRVRRTGGLPPLAVYEVEVHREEGGEGAEICRGTLGTWLAEEDGVNAGSAGSAPGTGSGDAG